ncbi:unnamed protein product [Merluccius merluccius]
MEVKVKYVLAICSGAAVLVVVVVVPSVLLITFYARFMRRCENFDAGSQRVHLKVSTETPPWTTETPLDLRVHPESQSPP